MTAKTYAQEIATRASTIHEAIGADLAEAGGLLRCGGCGTEQPLGDVADHLRNGWPQCCGYTMLWMTQRLLNEERAG
jgi:hypothetical protein